MVITIITIIMTIMVPQPRGFIPLYESVWNVADHRVKQLCVVFFKLPSNLLMMMTIDTLPLIISRKMAMVVVGMIGMEVTVWKESIWWLLKKTTCLIFDKRLPKLDAENLFVLARWCYWGVLDSKTIFSSSLFGSYVIANQQIKRGYYREDLPYQTRTTSQTFQVRVSHIPIKTQM